MSNVDQQQEKPKDFELIELLFREKVLISSAVSEDPKSSAQLEDFVTRFQSYINQIPSYSHSIDKPGFFTHFWFGAFSTVLDTRLNEKKLKIKELYFRFDDAKILKVVAQTDQNTHVFIFAEGATEQEFENRIKFTQGEWSDTIERSPLPSKVSKLKIDAIKILRKDKKISVERTSEALDIDLTSPSTKFKEIIPQFKNKNDFLENYIDQLANSDSKKVQENFEKFLSHLIEVHDKYPDIPCGKADGNTFREANHHGFLTGALSNYKYRYNGKIYPEQFSGSGYADLVVLFRGPDRITNAVRIIIELKAGDETPTTGLGQTDKYTAGPTRVLTTSDQVFCVGLNFDFKPKKDDVEGILSIIDKCDLKKGKKELREQIEKSVNKRDYHYIPKYIDEWDGKDREKLKKDIKGHMSAKFRYKTVGLERPKKPLMERILTDINEWDGTPENKDRLEKKIKNAFAHEYNGFPATKESKNDYYFSRYILGQSILVNKIDNDNVKKYLFSYKRSPLRDKNARSVKQTNPLTTLENNPVTTLVFIRGNDTQHKTAYVFHIKKSNTKESIDNKKIPIINISGTVKDVVEIYLELENYQPGKSFDQLFSIKVADKYEISSCTEGSFEGEPIQIGSSDILKGLFNTAIDSQGKIKLPSSSQISSDIPSGAYWNLFTEIAKIMYPIRDSINNEARLQGCLNGLASSYSDLKIKESFRSSNRNQKIVIIPEFQTGGGGRVDMLIQAIGPSDQGTKEYVPVLLEFKQVKSISLNQVQKDSLKGLPDDVKNSREKEFLIANGNKEVEKLTKDQQHRYAQGAAIKAITDGDKVAVMGVLFNTNAKYADTLIFTSKSFTTAVVVHSSITESRMAELEYILRGIKGEGEEKRKDLTFFELATKETRYDYRLQAQDIHDIARIEYRFEASIADGLFEIVGSHKHLTEQLKQFKDRVLQGETRPLTLIINLNNNHWVTLVISNKDGKYQGYYADSLGEKIPGNYKKVLIQNSITVKDLTCQTDRLPVQQQDNYNCGLWALENARDINAALRSTNTDTIGQIDKLLRDKREKDYFKEKRISLLKKLNEDPNRPNNLKGFNYKKYYNKGNGGSNVNLISYIGGSIRTRNTDPNGCLISCDEDVKKFNAETEDPRNYDKINIDSEEFLKNSSSVEDEDRQPQLMQLVDKVTHSISTFNLSNESDKSRLDHLKEQMSAMHSSKIGSTSFPTVAPTDITPLNLIHNSNNFSEAI